MLKAKQDNPEDSQGEPVNLTELHENSHESLLISHKERAFFTSTGISGCDFSASEEMQGQHHYTDYQQDVNQATGNVKGEETKQPKNNQNCSNCSQHFLTPFLAKRTIINLHGTNRDASLDSCLC
jgi:hypothetical protein